MSGPQPDNAGFCACGALYASPWNRDPWPNGAHRYHRCGPMLSEHTGRIEVTREGVYVVRAKNDSPPAGAGAAALKDKEAELPGIAPGSGAEGAKVPRSTDADGAAGVDKRTMSPDVNAGSSMHREEDPASVPGRTLSVEDLSTFYTGLLTLRQHAEQMAGRLPSTYDKSDPIRHLCNSLATVLGLKLPLTKGARPLSDDIGQGEGCEGGKCVVPEKKTT